MDHLHPELCLSVMHPVIFNKAYQLCRCCLKLTITHLQLHANMRPPTVAGWR